MGRIVRLLVLVVMTGNTAFSQTTPPRDDNQFWNETQLIKPTGKNKELIVIGVLRTGRNFARPVDERIGAGFNFKLNKHLSIIPTYLYVDQQPYDGRRIQEHRLVLNATIKFNAGAFAFMDRNLLERRVRHSSADFTVYRNRLQIDHPAKIGSFKFKPFIADEIWYSTQTSNAKTLGWFRNRISAGIIKQFGEHFSADIFYLRQNDGRSFPGNVHSIGTLFKIYLSNLLHIRKILRHFVSASRHLAPLKQQAFQGSATK